MQITITADDTADKNILLGFSSGSGWDASSGMTKKQWFREKLRDYILQTARSGYIAALRSPIQASANAAMMVSDAKAQTDIVEPTVTVNS